MAEGNPKVQAEKMANQLRRMGRKYTVKSGDSWFKIAGRIYGDQRMAGELARMNNGVNMLQPGMVLRLPNQRRNPYIGQNEFDGVGSGQPPAVPVSAVQASTAAVAPPPVNFYGDAPAYIPPGFQYTPPAPAQAPNMASGREGGLMGNRAQPQPTRQGGGRPLYAPTPAPTLNSARKQRPAKGGTPQTPPAPVGMGGYQGGQQPGQNRPPRRLPNRYQGTAPQQPPQQVQAPAGGRPVTAPRPQGVRPEDYIPPGYNYPPIPQTPQVNAPKQQYPTYNWQRQYQRPWDVRNIELLAQGQYPYTIPEQDLIDYGVNPLLVEEAGYQYVPEMRVYVKLNPAASTKPTTSGGGGGGYPGSYGGRGGRSGVRFPSYGSIGGVSRSRYTPVSQVVSPTGRQYFDPTEFSGISWRI
jgi:hypothetical protein